MNPAAGVAVRVTVVWSLKLAVQVDPQLIPDGLLLTAPEPTGPAWVTVTVKAWVGVGDDEELPPQADSEINEAEMNARDKAGNARRKMLTCESSSGLHLDRAVWMRKIPIPLYEHDVD